MDYSGKYRPILERIASLSGRSIGVPLFGGGGVPAMPIKTLPAPSHVLGNTPSESARKTRRLCRIARGQNLKRKSNEHRKA